MNTKYQMWFLLGILLCATQLSAQFKSAGSVNYQHLLLHYDGRSAGLAGADVALPGGVEGIIVNPASIGKMKSAQLFIGQQLLGEGVWCAPVAYGRSFSFGNIAVSLQGLTSGKIKVIDITSSGEPVLTGDFAENQYLTPAVTFARTFFNEVLSAGVSFKGMYQRIDVKPEIYSSKAFGFDCGVLYRINGDRFITGIALRNVGYEFSSFNDEITYPTPFIAEAGVSYIPRNLSSVRLCADIKKARGEYVAFEPGIEIEFYPKTFFVRLGYPLSAADIREQLNKLSGTKDDEYVKSNWSTLAGGIGIQTTVENVRLAFDCGIQFRDAYAGTAIVYSGIVTF